MENLSLVGDLLCNLRQGRLSVVIDTLVENGTLNNANALRLVFCQGTVTIDTELVENSQVGLVTSIESLESQIKIDSDVLGSQLILVVFELQS